MEDVLPPGPRWPPALQSLGMAQLPRFLDSCHRRYGDRFTVRLGRFGTFVYLVDPEDIRSVFHGDDGVFHAGEANAPFLGRVLGSSSVLVTDDEVHLRQRRRLSGPFHGDSVARLAAWCRTWRQLTLAPGRSAIRSVCCRTCDASPWT